MIPCTKEEELGRLKEFMEGMKGLKATLFTVSLAIILQVGTFLFLWGGLTTTVKTHDKNIDKILSKLENVNIIGYAYAKGEKGEQGERGVAYGAPGTP